MITPVRNISLGKINKTPKHQTQKTQQNQTQPYSINSLYSKDINFTGYISMKRKISVEEGIEQNFFNLPKITLDDGTQHQIMPDESQIECARKLCNGKNVVFDAPTGMGKTAIAHFAMSKNMCEDKKTIYTVPIKALANDKYNEFSKIYGKHNVGILTGDRKINVNAPITIMTTEIFDNQAQSMTLNDALKIGTVVYDEAHYIGDEERGMAWENSIINAASKGVQILALSATIGNADEFTRWIGKIPGARPTERVEVKSENRPVPLVWHLFRRQDGEERLTPILIGEIDLKDEELTDRKKAALEVLYKAECGENEAYKMTDDDYDYMFSQLKMAIGEGQNNFKYDTIGFKKILKREFGSLDKSQIDQVTELMARPDAKTTRTIHENWQEDDYAQLIKKLEKEDMLPAIIFKLAQGGCERAANSMLEDDFESYNEEELSDKQLKELEEQSLQFDLLNEKEKAQVQEIIDKYEQNGVYLGSNPQKNMLLRGWAVHHAGRLPQYKKLIEELFSKKLTKAVISTSTLGAGINMPARTVVMTNSAYMKYDENEEKYVYTPLSANEFHQMAGRAGRRGIDSVGHVVLYNLHTPPKGFRKDGETDKKGKIDELWLAYELMKSGADDVRSSYRPQPVMLAKYFQNNGDMTKMWGIINKSFKMHLSKDKDKAEKQMFKKFENYTQALMKQGFIIRNHKKEYMLTPKGELLTQCQGMNPLMLANLAYDGKLAKLNPTQLCQIAGHIQGSSTQIESDSLESLTTNRLKFALAENAGEETVEFPLREYQSTKDLFKKTEEKTLKALKEGRISKTDIKTADSFSGMVTYLFASLNNENPDESIKNFEKIIATTDSYASSDPITNKDYERKATEGNVYKIITGSISTLKQITRICDYAISDENNYPNTSYWENLKETAQEAIKLLDKEPINNDPDYANKSTNI